jgi:hypothetical protein
MQKFKNCNNEAENYSLNNETEIDFRTDDKEWDYCCRPDSNCGYSDGYDFSW